MWWEDNEPTSDGTRPTHCLSYHSKHPQTLTLFLSSLRTLGPSNVSSAGLPGGPACPVVGVTCDYCDTNVVATGWSDAVMIITYIVLLIFV